jgi:hypothetical protein
MVQIVLGVILVFSGLYTTLKKRVWLSNEYNDGFLATGCSKDFWGAIELIIGIVLIIWGISQI